MKKSAICLLLCLLLAVSIAPVISIQAEATSGTAGNLTWVYEDTVLTISGQGKMEYDSHAPWYDCYKTCTKVVIGEGVTNVAGGAFSHFPQLEEVSLPSTVTAIGDSSFRGCSKLSDIPLTHITAIGMMAFEDCDSFTQVNIHAGIETVGFGAFRGCNNLNKVTIENGVKTVESDAFASCSSLTEITLPDSVTKLGGGVFSDCAKLNKVTLSKNITEMGGNVFQDCPALETIVIPDKVPSIGGYAFEGCTNLRSITLGAGVKEIKETAFWRCPNLKSFTLSSANSHLLVDKGILYTKDKSTLLLAPPGFSGSYTVLSGTKTVGAYSFYECAGLTDVTIPDSVTVIDAYAFDWCKALKTVKLGSKVENIRTYAFSKTGLTTITLPATVRNVGDVAFADCDSLTEVIFQGEKPIFHDYTFLSVTAKCYHNGGETWKNMGNYGGRLTWEKINCNGKHTVETLPGTAATCTATGKTQGSRCSRCGAVLQAQTDIPAKGHSYGSWTVITPATTEVEGKSQRTCSACGKTEEKTVSKLTQATEPTVEATAPQDEPTQSEPDQPIQPSQADPDPAPQQPEKKVNPVTWVVIGVVAVVLAADAVAGAAFLRRRKK